MGNELNQELINRILAFREIDSPGLLVYAGPNGSGKSTVTSKLPDYGMYVNADDVKVTYNLNDLQAAQYAEIFRNQLLERLENFSFETVLSTDRNLKLMQKAKSLGYKILCVYVLTVNENINVARVRVRVAKGGHDVPEEKIRVRYHRALALIPQVIDVCDSIYIFDNSVEPVLVFKKELDEPEFFPNELWSMDKLRELIRC
jgi:predicted ABC-type ATPase